MERAKSHGTDGAAAVGEAAASARESLLRLALGDRLLESVHKAHVLVVGAGGASASLFVKCSFYYPCEEIPSVSLLEISSLQHRQFSVSRAFLRSPAACILSLRLRSSAL